jgi:hypothetical protein
MKKLLMLVFIIGCSKPKPYDDSEFYSKHIRVKYIIHDGAASQTLDLNEGCAMFQIIPARISSSYQRSIIFQTNHYAPTNFSRAISDTAWVETAVYMDGVLLNHVPTKF